MNLWVAVPTFIATIVWLAVVVYYGLRARWWRTPEGRNTQAVSLLMALVLLRLSIYHLTPDYVDLTVTGFLLYLGAALVGIWRRGLIEKAQRGILHWNELVKTGKNNTLGGEK